MKKEARVCSFYLDVKEVVKETHVFEFELCIDRCSDVAQQVHRGGSDHNVVDVEKKVDGVVPTTEGEQRAVRCRRIEAEVAEKAGEPCVPCPWSLFEAVEALGKLEDVVTMIRIGKPRWLPCVDRLVDEAVEEDVVDVELMHRPSSIRRECEDSADGGGLDNGAAGFAVVDAVALREATDHLGRLVPI